jgi:predicted MFS family arabinose efflux permease
MRLAANLGMGVGPAIGGLLALWDYRSLFVADAVTCWIAAWIVLRLPATIEHAESGPGRSHDGAVSPTKDGPFLVMLLLVVVLAVAFFQVFSTLPVYFRQVYGFREDAIGLLLALNAAIIALFEMVLIHRVERYERMALIGLGAVLVCVGFGLMPLGHSVPWAAATIVVWTLGEMLALPMLNAAVADRSGSGRSGRYMGLYTMAYSVAFVIAPGAGAWIYERFGPDALWYGVGTLAVPLAGLAWSLRRPFRAGGGHRADSLV